MRSGPMVCDGAGTWGARRGSVGPEGRSRAGSSEGGIGPGVWRAFAWHGLPARALSLSPILRASFFFRGPLRCNNLQM